MNFKWWLILFILIFLEFASIVQADSLDSIKKEVKNYLASQPKRYDSDDYKIKKIFTLEPKYKIDNYSSSIGYSRISSNYKIPSHISVSRVISTQIVRSKSKSRVRKMYRVKWGDTLGKIARKFGISLRNLKRRNRLKSNFIRAGQLLKIRSYVKYRKTGPGKKVTKLRVFTMPVINGRITSRYGYRRDPFNRGKKKFHSGLDLAAPVGTPIIASSDGIVEFTGRNGGYGNTVIIKHDEGYKTIYAHCSSTIVEEGQNVSMGRVIGTVGRTGTATGAHLHFEVLHYGKHVNPQKAFKKVKIIVDKNYSKKS